MPSGDRADDGPDKAPGTDQSPTQSDLASPPPRLRFVVDETVALNSVSSSSEASRLPRDTSGAVADLAEFQQTLIELGLISGTELRAFEVDASLGVLGLARSLVRAGRLTPYQSAAIYQKKSRGLLIGEYQILDKLGQGGMGMVFKARHRHTGRLGALKILPPSFARDRNAVLRFKREIEAAGRLKHPNLVAAFDAAEDRGVHFLVMDYVAGSDLDQIIRARGPMSVVEAVDCLIQAARGLEAAHAAGIVHRDIKPGNLMLDGDGTVRVLDLGLARIVEAANPLGQAAGKRLTDSGMCMGTVDYMAPEQAEDSRQAGHRADIYSLGCTHYYLLTGSHPFDGETTLKRLMAHQQQPAPKLRVARADVPPALETVFQKMMAKQPAERPATMSELIVHLLRCKSAAAAAPSPTTGDSPAKTHAPLRTFNEPARKQDAVPRTDIEPSIVTERDGPGGLRVDHDLSALDLVMDVRTDAPQTPLRATDRPFARFSSSRNGLGRRLSRYTVQHLEIAVIAVFTVGLVGALLARRTFFSSPDKPQTPASAEAPETGGSTPESKEAAAHGEPDQHLVSNTDTKSTAPAAGPTAASAPLVEVARLIGHDHPWVESVSALPDGRALLSGCVDHTVRLWDIATGREIKCLWHPDAVRAIFALQDGRRVLTGCADGFVRLWDFRTGQELRRLFKHAAIVRAVAVSPDGRLALSGSEDGVLVLSDLEKGGEVRRFEGQACAVWCAAFSPDGSRVLTGGHDGILRVGNTTSSEALVPHVGHKAGASIWSVAFSSDGRRAVTGSHDGTLIVWNLDSGQVVRQLDAQAGWIRCAAFLPGGRRVVCGTQNGTLAVWDLETGERLRAFRNGICHSGIALLPGGEIATADADGLVRIWQFSQPIARARNLAANGQTERALAPYQRAIADHPGDARLNIERGRLLAELGRSSRADADFSRAAQLAPDNPQLFVDAGWWVAGPYKLDLKTQTPIEQDASPSPSTPPPRSGEEPRQWVRAPTKMQGLVALKPISRTDERNVACYALAIVHSVTQRDVVMVVGTDDGGRFWLNGRQVLDSPRRSEAKQYAIEASLQPGRNTILAKVVNEGGLHRFFLRISDAPADFLRAHVGRKEWQSAIRDYSSELLRDPSLRDPSVFSQGGVAFAELGQWKEATIAFKRCVDLTSGSYWARHDLLISYLAEGDLASYRRLCRETIETLGKKPDALLANNLAWLAALIPDAVATRHDYDELLLLARKVVDTKDAPWIYLNTFGALLYRAGKYESAVNFLNRSIRNPKNEGSAFDYVFLAMAAHRLRHPDDRKALKRATELAGKPSPSWNNRAELRVLLDEAKRELELPPAR